MDRQQRQRLRAVLLTLPDWEEPRSRRSLLDFLRGHDIWHRLMRGGNDIDAANDLLDRCTDADLARIPIQGRSPLCALIEQLKQHLAQRPAPITELARLEEALCNRPLDLPRGSWTRPPYPGLAFFDRDDWPIYFGRESELQRLIQALAGRPPDLPGAAFLVVVGASGSGKSSLVRAGLWARLALGRVPELHGSEDWLVTAMTPADPIADEPLAVLRARTVQAIGEHQRLRHAPPVDWADWVARIDSGDASLADLGESLLAEATPSAQWLLILDQMEELFTACPGLARERFITQLIDAIRPGAGGEPSRVRVLATIRADFFHHCVAHRALRPLVQAAGSLLIGAPQQPDLERMIEAPLIEVDLQDSQGRPASESLPWSIEPALVRQLASEAQGRDGGLALMAFALRELYERCAADRYLSMNAYQAMGGLGGAIAKRASDELAQLGAGADQALAAVFVHLVHVRGDEPATRQIAKRSTWPGDSAANRLIDRFIAARLLVAGKDGEDQATVEVAHEALLREWPRLAQWIEDSREALRQRDRIDEEVRTWVAQERPSVRLWKHELLAPARQLLVEAGLLHDLEQDPDTADFLTPEADWLLAELLCCTTDHARREAIGMRLSAIGDPRPGVGVIDGVPDILWCAVPAGEVDIEGHGRFQVQPFRIAAYPVTYTQYRAFLDADDGYCSDQWWEDLRKDKKPGQRLRPFSSYPADSVSWWDATAYCRWLSHRLGLKVRLPDEWEWQWAAQSARRSFTYPWGHEWREGVANTSEAGIGRTTAVGMYLNGRSKQGAYDLGGNVWEWCRNEYDVPKKIKPQSDECRVVRGGSWIDAMDGARVAFRKFFQPDLRFGDYGFRLLWDSPAAER